MTSKPPSPSMSRADVERPEFDALHAVEDRHFWFRERNRILGTVVGQVTARLAPGYRVLEVGCGTGNVLHMLEQVCRDGEVMGSELFEEGLVYARQRCRCPVVQADIFAMPFTTPFDVIGLFDVLEHLEQDRRALEALHVALVPGGALVLTVPAHQQLWSYADEISGHYRRYERGGLLALLEGVGFQIEYHTPFMTALYPCMWLTRRLTGWRDRLRSRPQSRRDKGTRELRVGGLMNRVMTWLHHWETAVVARRGRMPWGTSLLVVARKPGVAVRSAA